MRKLTVKQRISGFWEGVALGAASPVDVYCVPKTKLAAGRLAGMSSDREALISDVRRAEKRFARSIQKWERRSTN